MEKRVQDYTQEILDTIRSNSSPAVMGSRLEDYHENDLADVLPLLTVPERCKLYRILDTDMLSDIFEYAESDNVAEYLEEMDVKKAASILSKMETDALAEVLQKLDKAKKKLLIELLDPEVRHDIEMIASFDEDEIGSRMTTNCIIIREDLNRTDGKPLPLFHSKSDTNTDFSDPTSSVDLYLKRSLFRLHCKMCPLTPHVPIHLNSPEWKVLSKPVHQVQLLQYQMTVFF